MALPAAPPLPRMTAFLIDALVATAAGVALAGAVAGHRRAALIAVGVGGALVALALYETLVLAVAGTSLGKVVCGLRVTMLDGGRVTIRAAFRRAFLGRLLLEHGLLLTGGAGVIGYLSGLVSRDRRAWHDRVCGTRVVSTRRAWRPDPSLAPPYTPMRRRADNGLELGAFWERLGAFMLDAAFVATIAGTLVGPLLVFTGQVKLHNSSAQTPGWLGGAVIGGLVGIWVAYTTLAIWMRETTLGKNAVGLVVRRADGGRVGARRAVLRELVGRILLVGGFGTILAGIGPAASMIMLVCDRNRQSLYDKVARTVVVRAAPRRRRTAA